jgi:hypothetical protein
MKKIIGIGCLLTILTTCLVTFAQELTQEQKQAIEKAAVATKARSQKMEMAAGVSMAANAFAFGQDTFTFIAAEGGFGGKTVKGAPYSADAVNENIQVLHDGNRIVRKNSSSVARDSEGRTRQEHTIRSIGPYASAGDPPQTFSINDPVTGTHYMLDQRSKTAHKMMIHVEKIGAVDSVVMNGKIATTTVRADGSGAGDTVVYTTEGGALRTFDVHGKKHPAPAGIPEDKMMTVERVPGAGTMEIRTAGKPENFKTESLGTQNIEGVAAEGTRTTVTIPAGEIGNEQPINIVTESWYSPELQVTVMRKHTDPRHGEMNYRLTNIKRSEPDRSLFEVPADYTIKESVSPRMKLDLEREIVREKTKAKEKNDQ